MKHHLPLLGLLFLLGCSTTEPATQTEARVGPKGEAILSAADLTGAYRTDPAAFDEKFRHKMVIVEGVIAWDSFKDEKGIEHVPLEGAEGTYVRCMRTGGFAEQVQGMKAGRKITVRGRANPYQEGRPDVLLTECDLVVEPAKH